MELVLIRHGLAEDRRPDLEDSDRALTDEGRRRLGAVLIALQRLDLGVELLHHSPWRRAEETARILAPLARRPPVAMAALAAPPGEALVAQLAAAPEERVALIGHQPWLGELAALLCLGDPAAGRAFRIRKGGVLGLQGQPAPGGMELEAALRPAHLRRIAALGSHHPPPQPQPGPQGRAPRGR